MLSAKYDNRDETRRRPVARRAPADGQPESACSSL